MSTSTLLMYIATMAIVTYAIRAIPLVFIRRDIKSVFIRSFLYYVPYAVLGAMTIPAVFFATQSVISAAVGLIVAVILAWFDRGLLTVAAVACVAVFITEWVMTMI